MLRYLLLVFLLSFSIHLSAQSYFRAGVGFGANIQLVENNITNRFTPNSYLNSSGQVILQFLFQNGFGLETGFVSSNRDYWWKRKNLSPISPPQRANMFVTSYGIPFLLIKQPGPNFQKRFGIKYQAGFLLDWQRHRNSSFLSPMEGQSGLIPHIGAGIGLLYSRFELNLHGFFALKDNFDYMAPADLSDSGPIHTRQHSLQLDLRLYFTRARILG